MIRALERNNVEEACDLLHTVSFRHHAELVFEMVNGGVEHCFRTRRKIGRFLIESIEKDLLKPGNVRCGIKRFMEVAEEVEVDVPRLWFHLGQICAPLLSDDRIFPMQYLEESCESLADTEKTLSCVLEIVKEALEIFGKEKVLAYWNSSEFAQKWLSKATMKGLLS